MTKYMQTTARRELIRLLAERLVRDALAAESGPRHDRAGRPDIQPNEEPCASLCTPDSAPTCNFGGR